MVSRRWEEGRPSPSLEWLSRRPLVTGRTGQRAAWGERLAFFAAGFLLAVILIGGRL